MNNKLIFRKIKKIKSKKIEKGQTEPLSRKTGGGECHEDSQQQKRAKYQR